MELFLFNSIITVCELSAYAIDANCVSHEMDEINLSSNPAKLIL
jgi:hypothetical protein